MWLYAYEASLKGWTGTAPKRFITADKAFGALWERKVSFFDLNAHTADVGVSSKRDMALSLKVKSAVGVGSLNFDFGGDEAEDWSEDQDDYEDDWSEY
jgi:hypothetical protein